MASPPADEAVRLSARPPADVPEFSFDGCSFFARLVDVHDGDTVKVVFELDGTLTKMSLRLTGIDAPEIRTRSASEKAAAVRARDAILVWAAPELFAQGRGYGERTIREVLAAEPVFVHVRCAPFDKYGRVLATMCASDDPSARTLNAHLLSNGYARAYNGGTKEPYAEGST